MSLIPPINLQQWIDDNRHLLKPPVGNKVVYEDSGTTVMIVGGPNQRSDYHINDGEEFFYMLEGDMVLKVVEDGQFQDIDIREGEVFLLPPGVPHSPQRLPNTVGLVIETPRQPGDVDYLRWYCQKCGAITHEKGFVLEDIAKQLEEIIGEFNTTEDLRRCPECDDIHTGDPSDVDREQPLQ